MHLFMVQIDYRLITCWHRLLVQVVGACLMHFFMGRVDYRLFMVQVDYRLFGAG
jgi:hypothetical protein